MKSKSFIEIPVAIVIAECESMIKLIDADREKEWQAKIQYKVEKFNKSWWNRIRGKTMTTADASAYLKECHGEWDFFSEYAWTMTTCESQRQKCEALIRLCKAASNGVINLTCEDAKEIGL